MSKTSTHEIESDRVQVCRMVDFCRGVLNSCTRNNVVEEVDALLHSTNKNDLICLSVSDSIPTTKKFDPTSSFVELPDGEKGDI